MVETRALADGVHEALVRLEAVKSWLRYVELGRCEPDQGRATARELTLEALVWLAKAVDE